MLQISGEKFATLLQRLRLRLNEAYPLWYLEISVNGSVSPRWLPWHHSHSWIPADSHTKARLCLAPYLSYSLVTVSNRAAGCCVSVFVVEILITLDNTNSAYVKYRNPEGISLDICRCIQLRPREEREVKLSKLPDLARNYRKSQEF